MHRPVLVTPPATPPVSWEEADAHLRLDGDAGQKPLVEALIVAATAHLDGWTGILGRCLVEQTWRQDFDCFSPCLRLPLGPVLAVGSVKWRNADGQESTVGSASYTLITDAGGRSRVRFKDSFAPPADLDEVAAVSVTYTAGYPTVGGVSTVPAAIKQAILLHIGHLYKNREAVNAGGAATELPLAYAALIAPYRGTRI